MYFENRTGRPHPRSTQTWLLASLFRNGSWGGALVNRWFIPPWLRVCFAPPVLPFDHLLAALPLGLSARAEATAVAAAGFGYAFGVRKTPPGGLQ